MSVELHDLSSVTLLLNRGANVDAAMFNGCTALHLAVGRQDASIANLLCQAGADKMIRNLEDETALDLADGNDDVRRLSHYTTCMHPVFISIISCRLLNMMRLFFCCADIGSLPFWWHSDHGQDSNKLLNVNVIYFFHFDLGQFGHILQAHGSGNGSKWSLFTAAFHVSSSWNIDVMCINFLVNAKMPSDVCLCHHDHHFVILCCCKMSFFLVNRSYC